MILECVGLERNMIGMSLTTREKKGKFVFFLLELIQASNVSIDMIDRSLPAKSEVCSRKDF